MQKGRKVSLSESELKSVRVCAFMRDRICTLPYVYI